MKRFTAFIPFILILSIVLLSGCSKSTGQTAYKDGTYTGKSSTDDRGAYGEASITIADGKITECTYITWQEDGTQKDENYGKVNGEISNPDFYNKAQTAVHAMKEYADKLVEVQKPEEIDAVSGATVAYNQFKEAVSQALDSAKQ